MHTHDTYTVSVSVVGEEEVRPQPFDDIDVWMRLVEDVVHVELIPPLARDAPVWMSACVCMCA
eukprot:56575-Eustigmatos_ZCMA.PRE.1